MYNSTNLRWRSHREWNGQEYLRVSGRQEIIQNFGWKALMGHLEEQNIDGRTLLKQKSVGCVMD